MSLHPVNLAVRFVLEIAALVVIGYWGFRQHTGILQYVLPLVAAASWGIVAVPGDRARSGDAPVPVPGAVRLLLELFLFALASWAFYDAGNPVLALILAGVTVMHYALSFDRIGRLLRYRGPEMA
jgi:hypothetical protein